jgi:hypothetical protein
VRILESKDRKLHGLLSEDFRKIFPQGFRRIDSPALGQCQGLVQSLESYHHVTDFLENGPVFLWKID